MSDTVRSYGFIAILATRMSNTEEFNDITYEDKSILKVNYEGTLVYCDFNRHADYDIRTDLMFTNVGQNQQNVGVFEKELKKHKLAIVQNIEPYNCIWYNGSDCPIDELTKEDVLNGVSD